MLSRLVLAVVVAVVVTQACVLVGGILASLGISIAVTIGDFLKSYSGILGVLAGLSYYFSGSSWWPTRKV
jgi:hypothetical protein